MQSEQKVHTYCLDVLSMVGQLYLKLGHELFFVLHIRSKLKGRSTHL